MGKLLKQHLIDPEICIRCYTCEETCPIDAISHNDDNVVVDASICNYCMDCIAPCPTGSIDNWRIVNEPYSLEQQLIWEELPDEIEHGEDDSGKLSEAIDQDIADLIATAHQGVGGKPIAPASAAKPSVNLYSRKNPLVATVQGNYRITEDGTETDVRHLILNLEQHVFPILEGQSVGIQPPVEQPDDSYHFRLYSVCSPRDGEKRNANNIALTVKRESNGLCSNYLCDVEKGDQISLIGPFGGSFLMPNDPNAHILMICTGTGSAPFRGFTERRRRAAPGATGKLMLFFGARSPQELPYFGPLSKLPDELIEKQLVFSRVENQPKEYVQDRMIKQHQAVLALLQDPQCHIFVCGLKAMEAGVEEAFEEICLRGQMHWDDLKTTMRASGRYHVETY